MLPDINVFGMFYFLSHLYFESEICRLTCLFPLNQVEIIHNVLIYKWISHVIDLKISKLIRNIFHFIYCVFDIHMYIGLCIEVVVFEIKLSPKKQKTISWQHANQDEWRMENKVEKWHKLKQVNKNIPTFTRVLFYF